MGFDKRYIFNESCITDQAVFILWCEKLPDNFYESLDASNYGYIVSPEHSPDSEHGKKHRHLAIRDMHGRSLDYEKVSALLETINPKHQAGLPLRGGHKGLVKQARYFVHLDNPEKQQFDLRPPTLGDEYPINDEGISEATGLVNIYADKVCFYDGGGLDFIKLIHITARESAEIQKQITELNFKKVVTYINDECIRDFNTLVNWCLNNHLLNICTRYSYPLSLLCKGNSKRIKETNNNISTSEKQQETDEEYNNKVTCTSDSDNCLQNRRTSENNNFNGLDNNTYQTSKICYEKSEIEEAHFLICTSVDVSSINPVVIEWFLYLHPNFLESESRFDKMIVKRQFLKDYDIINDKPRKYMLESFNDYCRKRGICI